MKIRAAKVIVTCPGRNMVTLEIETDKGIYGITDQSIECTALGIAAWIMHVQQAQTEQCELNDPLAPRLVALTERHHGQPQALIAAFLAQDDIFTPQLAANNHFQQALARAYNALQQGALSGLLQRLTSPSD
jgi:fructuronate reductase